MTSIASERIARVVPPGLRTTPAERDAILEIAYLCVAADHKLADEELAALRQVAGKLEGRGPLTEAALDELLGRFAEWRAPGEIPELLRGLAAKLSPAARTLAYRVAYGLAVCDLDTSDEEFEFDLQLIDALELTADQASALAEEVQGALQGE